MPFSRRARMRAWLLVAYGLQATLGATTLFYPSPTFENANHPLLTLIWSGMLAVGGLAGLGGIIGPSFAAEISGLILLITSSAGYGVTMLIEVESAPVPPSGVLALALAALLANRLADTLLLLRAARRDPG